MNLAARPAGGIMSDRLGSRRRTLTLVTIGVLLGYVLLSTMGAAWPWALAIVACMVCSFFVQAGAGAVFAVVPLVKKRVSGQIAGMAGAYGNIGGVAFLTVGLFVSTQVFFLTIAGAAVVAMIASLFLVEPAESFATELQTEPSAPTRCRAAVHVRSRLVRPRPVPFPRPSSRRQRAPRDSRRHAHALPVLRVNCGIGLSVANDTITDSCGGRDLRSPAARCARRDRPPGSRCTIPTGC